MMPFIRMALFQSFKVDFPARCTNSFGLITCSSYYKETQKYRTFSAWHRSGETVAQPILPSSSSLHQDFTGRNSMALPGTGLSTEHFDTACHENMPSGQCEGQLSTWYLACCSHHKSVLWARWGARPQQRMLAVYSPTRNSKSLIHYSLSDMTCYHISKCDINQNISI